jgi:hypothetical protein
MQRHSSHGSEANKWAVSGAVGKRHDGQRGVRVDTLERRVFMSVAPISATNLVGPATSVGPVGPVASAAAAVAPVVTGYTLINADTDQPIAAYTNLAATAVLDLTTLPTKKLNIRANVGTGVASVKFGYDTTATYGVRSTAPFAFAGAVGTNYNAWTPTVGTHTVKATPYSAKNATGTAGKLFAVTFKVIQSTPAAVSLSASDPSAKEVGNDSGTVVVTRTGSTASPLTVKLGVAGTATEGTDYESLLRTVTIPAGSTMALVTVRAKDDFAREPSETVVVSAVAGTGYTITSGKGSTTVTIVDDDQPVPQAPFPGPAVPTLAAGGRLEAENFDVGGDYVSFHIPASIARVSPYRGPSFGPPVVAATDPADATPGGGFALDRIPTDTFFEYTVDVATSGLYDLNLRYAAGGAGGGVHLHVDDLNASGNIPLASTGGWDTWATGVAPRVALTAGRHVLALGFDSAPVQGSPVASVNWVQFSPSVAPASAPRWPAAFEPAAADSNARAGAALATANGKAYAVGGTDPAGVARRSLAAYDPSVGTWADAGPLPDAMATDDLTAAADPAGAAVYVVAIGVDPTAVVDDPAAPPVVVSQLWKYDVAAGTWAALAAPPTLDGSGSLAVAGGTVRYVGAGSADAGTSGAVPLHLAYDVATDAWSAAAVVPGDNAEVVPVVAGGALFAAARANAGLPAASSVQLYRYDATADAWSAVGPAAPVVADRLSGHVLALDNRIVVIGASPATPGGPAVAASFDLSAGGWAAGLLPVSAAGAAADGDVLVVSSLAGGDALLAVGRSLPLDGSGPAVAVGRLSAAPAAVTVTAAKAATTGLTVSWVPPPGSGADVRTYRVRYAAGYYFQGVALTPQTIEVYAPATSVLIPGLQSNTLYGVTVTPVDAAGHEGVPALATPMTAASATTKRYLYVLDAPKQKEGFETMPRQIEVFDVANGHQWVKNIPLPAGVFNIRGVAASTVTSKLFVSYYTTAVNDAPFGGGMLCMDLTTNAIVWRKDYDPAVVPSTDRFDVTPDGKTIYLPLGEQRPDSTEWKVIDAATGNVTGGIVSTSNPHNTIVSVDGRYAFLEGQERGPQDPAITHTVGVVDTTTNQVVKLVGPFRDTVRPFTINGAGTLIYAAVNNFVGFQIGDVTTGQVVYTVEPPNYVQPPSDPALRRVFTHGIALTPDEKEVWAVDQLKGGIQIWDVSKVPAEAPRYVGFVAVRKKGKNLAGATDPAASRDTPGTPGWVAASYDGKYMYAEGGEIISVATHTVVGQLRAKTVSSTGVVSLAPYSHSRFIIEVDFDNGRATRVSNQFGIGRVR